MKEKEISLVMGFLENCYSDKIIQDNYIKNYNTIWEQLDNLAKAENEEIKALSLFKLEEAIIEAIYNVKKIYFNYGLMAQKHKENVIDRPE